MKKIILYVMLSLLLSAFALAYNVNWNVNTNLAHGIRTYACSGSNCDNSVVSLLQEKHGTSSSLQFAGSGSPDYYAVFLWPEDKCHVPTAFHTEFSTTTNYNSNYNFIKTQSSLCGSNVGYEDISNENPTLNEEVFFGAYLEAAWGASDAKVMWVPNDLEKYYQSKVDVNFYVNDVLVEHRFVNISFTEHWLWEDFNFTPTTPGTYKLRIESKMDNDCKCLGSNTKYVEKTFTIEGEKTYCGDGIIQSPNDDGEYEQCDDGNTENGDGCSSECTVEPYCGDGVVNNNEQCELPNTDNNVYCPQGPVTVCEGNQTGTRDSYGSCNAQCGCVPDNYRYTCLKDSCNAQCAVDSDCDDGNVHTLDTCDTEGCGCSHLELPYCGDGKLDPGEQCDDGNNNSDDGCSSTCTIETACGNGILDPGEECDDGNLIDGDGCSAVCTIDSDVPEFNGTALAVIIGLTGLFIYGRKK